MFTQGLNGAIRHKITGSHDRLYVRATRKQITHLCVRICGSKTPFDNQIFLNDYLFFC